MKNLPHLKPNEAKALELLSTKLKNYLKNNLILMKAFGSKVRGEFTDESDIDVLIIVKQRTLEIQDNIAGIVADIDLEYDPKISLLIYSEFEYFKNKEMGSLFVENVEKEGISL